MITDDAAVPVYFAWETEELREIYDDIYSSSSGDQAATAVEGTLIRAWQKKPVNWPVCPAKTRISLGIRSVWS